MVILAFSRWIAVVMQIKNPSLELCVLFTCKLGHLIQYQCGPICKDNTGEYPTKSCTGTLHPEDQTFTISYAIFNEKW